MDRVGKGSTMTRLCAYLTSAVLLGGIASATAQPIPPPPTKTVTIVNNSPNHTFWVALEAPIIEARDQWLQNQFKVGNRGLQVFQTTLLYRIFVNRNAGIPPGGSVTVTLPFYTQLQDTALDNPNLGTIKDQFIDWWSSARMFIWDGKDAADAAFNFETLKKTTPSGDIQVKAPPADITPIAGAALPSCTCDILIKAYHQGPARGVPFQLVEFTFADAINSGEIFLDRVNINISGVDSVYLPVAIGAHGNG